MSIPKSQKLQLELEEKANLRAEQEPSVSPAPVSHGGAVIVKPVKCCNDFVAILQEEVNTSITLSDMDKFKNEGLVVGVGPGLSDGHGGRLAPTVKIGDYVLFGGKPTAVVESAEPPYAGKKVVLLPDRNIMCVLSKSIDYVLMEDCP